MRLCQEPRLITRKRRQREMKQMSRNKRGEPRPGGRVGLPSDKSVFSASLVWVRELVGDTDTFNTESLQNVYELLCNNKCRDSQARQFSSSTDVIRVCRPEGLGGLGFLLSQVIHALGRNIV